MSVFKCKMCGGALEISDNRTVAVCAYCGTKQTLPKLSDSRRADLYDRANHFRRNNEFDKASAIYENILNEDKTDAEAYWSLVLCRYGIEYVEDPATHKRVPTVNRTQFTSIFNDDNYRSALQYADVYQRSIYESEAGEINEIQRSILAISQKEEPFDIFICYKETDSAGRRTQDSVIANELYYQLTNEGFKVFFSRITLEDKLGTAYEPYIFAALNSAKVMVVIGTKPEHFNAVWVKNEWSRYLSLVKASNGKKVLIPAYRDMDPYDLPEEFSHLQAQDMSNLGFMQDLIRGIKKLIPTENANDQAVQTNGNDKSGGDSSDAVAPLLRRAFMALEDGEWQKADGFCEQALNIYPECADAYVIKLMAQFRCRHRQELQNCQYPFDKDKNYLKACRFGSNELRAELGGYIKAIIDRRENIRLSGIYTQAMNKMTSARTEADLRNAAAIFHTIPNFTDSRKKEAECLQRADEFRRAANAYNAQRQAAAAANRGPVNNAQNNVAINRAANTVPVQPKKKSHAGLIIVLVIVFLIIGAGVGGGLLLKNFIFKDKPDAETYEADINSYPYEDETEYAVETEQQPFSTATEKPEEDENICTYPVISKARTITGAELGASNVDSTRSFGADRAIDGNGESCWCVSTTEKGGRGAQIKFELEEYSRVSKIAIVNGNQYQPYEDIYKSNGQIQKFTLTFGNGEKMTFTASFNSGSPSYKEYFELPYAVDTDSITLTVDSAYVGQKYDSNVCLTDFYVY